MLKYTIIYTFALFSSLLASASDPKIVVISQKDLDNADNTLQMKLTKAASQGFFILKSLKKQKNFYPHLYILQKLSALMKYSKI